MIYNRYPLPREGDILIATVKQVFDYGSYVTLDEYGGLQAFLPWSEISTRWVKNIRDVVKEGRKIIVKVIRVDRKKGSVDVSLKKVNDDDRRKKNAQWKRIQKIDKILEIVAQKLKKSEKEAWEQVAWKLEEKYGDVYEALQKASKEGEKVLLDAGVPEIWIKPILEEASKHGEEKKVKESKVVLVKSLDPDGVDKIRKVFDLEDEGDIRIFTIGAPRYRVEVSGTDPKAVAQRLEEVVQRILERAKEEGVSAEVAK
ncbi:MULTISPECIES: translation initiation factor IF-2 subunit alpha [Metallosphaera]|uniref:Translation initiation factor 2 subunit alpha (AeIF-2a) n=2 Tax=Metallosphaera sedula TaxID=43687 RepID=A4YHQ4_METS5|nr:MULTISPECIES: translation initiation factor IF-2 subunit alpha [Metallosphaera]ABP95956.1 translation initiation factor 2 subunit alpha (aeIF-2a) [Metallosphaera sedula DSM 5348]AIM27940.1 translation initiation factor 2 subunit alpha (aeIF-2a) [Metallosphaera sedula]AKV74772.1 translation initiation factor IF-2 subunit alpha [Metallosphaera sedula]AKV77008.1 translation initiation factor IF-2 subunit alpha [Metallosphaera sedula]AKV79260.1 translation initiation factor IF-2 subunit alpha [